jgi:hypothetical protein
MKNFYIISVLLLIISCENEYLGDENISDGNYTYDSQSYKSLIQDLSDKTQSLISAKDEVEKEYKLAEQNWKNAYDNNLKIEDRSKSFYIAKEHFIKIQDLYLKERFNLTIDEIQSSYKSLKDQVKQISTDEIKKILNLQKIRLNK